MGAGGATKKQHQQRNKKRSTLPVGRRRAHGLALVAPLGLGDALDRRAADGRLLKLPLPRLGLGFVFLGGRVCALWAMCV
jgi:hypothetical protein